MVEKKNLAILIEAYAEVKRAHPASGLGLVFVGSGECQPQLVRRCGELGLSYSLTPTDDVITADVLFYGFRQINENPVFYALAEAFVLPSLYEEWGLVVNEAMACGLPVLVSSTVGSAEDLVVPGQNGFHFDPQSPSELARHMSFLLEHPKERERMGLTSAERIKDWGCENFAQRAREVLYKVMGVTNIP
jgi:glycosyltransferase involved in cell wall biosynthesis